MRPDSDCAHGASHLVRESLDLPDRSLRSWAEFGGSSLPCLTPIRQAFALTPKLLAAFSHPSAALRAHAIQNARDNILARLHTVASDELHSHLTNLKYFGYP